MRNHDAQTWWDKLNADIAASQEKLRVELKAQAYREAYGSGASLSGRPGRYWLANPLEVTFTNIDRELFAIIYGRNTEKETTFMQRRADIKARLAQLEREYAALERFPDDNFADGTVVKFDRITDEGTESEKTWSFAAMKFGKAWYLTAQRGKVVTWETLCQYAGNSAILVADGWTTAVQSKEDFDAPKIEVSPEVEEFLADRTGGVQRERPTRHEDKN